MWVYNLLDITVTVTECLVMYFFTGIFCKKPKFLKNVSRLIPTVLVFALTVFLTHFTELGAVKIFIVFSVLALMIKLCYTISVREIIIVVELSYLVIAMFSESVVITILGWIYNNDIMITFDGTSVLKWQIYVASIISKLVLLIIIHFAFRNFVYQFKIRDVVVLSISFLLAFFVSFLSVYITVNLQMERALGLDLITTILSMCFIIQFLYSKNSASIREQEQQNRIQLAQLQQQFVYYQNKQKDEERVRAIYHDMKNHLLILENQQNTEETHRMAEKLRSQIADYEDYVHTGNDFLDVIIKEKAEKMREKQIDFSAVIDFGDVDFIEPLDISTIFGNALDNAIEASEKLPVSQRMITVKAACIRNMLVISVVNNIADETVITEKTTKADGLLHGFGLSNIRQAAEKYGGTCTTEQEDERFVLKILLPVAERKAVE